MLVKYLATICKPAMHKYMGVLLRLHLLVCCNVDIPL